MTHGKSFSLFRRTALTAASAAAIALLQQHPRSPRPHRRPPPRNRTRAASRTSSSPRRSARRTPAGRADRHHRGQLPMLWPPRARIMCSTWNVSRRACRSIRPAPRSCPSCAASARTSRARASKARSRSISTGSIEATKSANTFDLPNIDRIEVLKDRRVRCSAATRPAARSASSPAIPTRRRRSPPRSAMAAMTSAAPSSTPRRPSPTRSLPASASPVAGATAISTIIS